jgi:hypothetical protein
MNDIERQVLLYGAQPNPNQDHQHKLLRFMTLEFNREHLMELAVKEGLAGLLYKNLVKFDLLDAVDPRHGQYLKRLYEQTLFFNMRLINDLKEVLIKADQREGIVLLQGISLLHETYSDPGLRPMGDIDLWILEENYPRFINLLERCRYRRDPVYPNTFRRGATIFDIHTHIFWADRIKSRNFLSTRHQDDIYDKTRVIEFEGCKVRCLGKYDQILYLGLHALKHNVERLVWLMDIRQLIADWNHKEWKEFDGRCIYLGQDKFTSYIFFLLGRLSDFHLPDVALKFVDGRKMNALEKGLLRKRSRGPLPIWAPFLLFSPQAGLRRRLSFMLETLFPKAQTRRQIFPGIPPFKRLRFIKARILQLLGTLFHSIKRI